MAFSLKEYRKQKQQSQQSNTASSETASTTQQTKPFSLAEYRKQKRLASGYYDNDPLKIKQEAEYKDLNDSLGYIDTTDNHALLEAKQQALRSKNFFNTNDFLYGDLTDTNSYLDDLVGNIDTAMTANNDYQKQYKEWERRQQAAKKVAANQSMPLAAPSIDKIKMLGMENEYEEQQKRNANPLNVAKDYFSNEDNDKSFLETVIDTYWPSTGNPKKQDVTQVYPLTGNTDVAGYEASHSPKNPLYQAENATPEMLIGEEQINGKSIQSYTYMTDAEKDYYNRLYGSQGPEAAEGFHTMLLDSINYRIANDQYNKVWDSSKDENIALKAVKGLGKQTAAWANSTVGTIRSGTRDLALGVLGSDNSYAATTGDYLNAAIRNDTDNSGLFNLSLDAAQAIGGMTPAIIANLATGGASIVGDAATKLPAWAAKALTHVNYGQVVQGLSVAGRAYREALNNGESVGTSQAYGVLQGTDEFVTNLVFGGIGQLGKGVVAEQFGEKGAQILGKVLDKIAATPRGKWIGNTIVKYAANGVSEGLQEGFQDFTQNLHQVLLGMKDKDGNPVQLKTKADEDTFYSMLLGAVTSLLLGFGSFATEMSHAPARTVKAPNVETPKANTNAMGYDPSVYWDGEYEEVTPTQNVDAEPATDVTPVETPATGSPAAAEFAAQINGVPVEDITQNVPDVELPQNVQSVKVTDSDGNVSDALEPVSDLPSVDTVQPVTDTVIPDAMEVPRDAEEPQVVEEAYRPETVEELPEVIEPQETAPEAEIAPPELPQPVDVEEEPVQLTSIDDRAKQFPDNAGKVYVESYNGEDIVEYDENMKKAYNAGNQGKSLATLMNDIDFNIFYNGGSSDALEAMYNAGRRNYLENLAKQNTAAQATLSNEENDFVGTLESTHDIYRGGLQYHIMPLSKNEYIGYIRRGQDGQVTNARDVIYRSGIFKTSREAALDLLEVARNNKFVLSSEKENGTDATLTADEERAILRYRSSDSYKINDIFINGKASDLTEHERVFVLQLDNALEKTPIYEGRTYRNITFDRYGSYAKEEFDKFTYLHSVGNIIRYPAYTSASKVENGYLVKGKYLAHITIDGHNGRDLEKYGTQEGVEVVFQRNSSFVVKSKRIDGTEVFVELEETDERGGIQRSNNGNNTVEQGSSLGSSRVSEMQPVQSEDMGNVRSISTGDSEKDSDGSRGVSEVSAEVINGSSNEEVSNVTVEETNREVHDVGGVLQSSGTGAADGRVLDGVSPEDVSKDEGTGDLSSNTGEGRGTSGRDDAESDEGTGTLSERGTGVSERGDIQPTTGRGRGNVGESAAEAGAEGAHPGRGVRSDSETETGLPGLQRRGADAPDQQIIPETASEPLSDLPESTAVEITQNQADSVSPHGANYVIPVEGLKLPNGEKARYKANIAAIKTLRAIMAEGRFATPEEQTILAKYVGWGGLANAFDPNKSEWAKEYKELKKLLTESEWNAAMHSTLNAHYTDISVIHAMYGGLKKLGFDGGRVLEPSSGIGHFIGAMPADLTSKVKSWTAVELDELTGNIAKTLYPNANVFVQGYETVSLPDDYMDLIISNVPFGNYPISDKTYPKSVTSSIHNYFFAKSLDKVRTGGIICFITSRYTMDSNDSAVREYIMNRADLLGAIRLPDTAFKGNAGTSVVTDIIVLKKRETNTPYAGEEFKDSSYNHRDLGIWETTNNYFVSHPEMVLGTAKSSGSMYRGNSLTYEALPGKLDKQIEKAFGKIKGKMEYPATQTQADIQEAVRKANKSATGKSKNGNYVKVDGKIYKNNNGQLEETNLSKNAEVIMDSAIALRDTARELLTLQQQNGSEAEITKLRAKLNSVYDEFVKKNGPLNKQSNRKVLQDDTDFPFILSLENYDKDTKVATKADIFSVNTITPNVIVDHVSNIIDGAAASINETGGIDVALIARLMGTTNSSVEAKLVEGGLAFRLKDGSMQPAQMYLSGNVRAKLKEARALATVDPTYKANVTALEKVVPKDIAPEDISVQPGATWIPAQVYADFAAEILGGSNNGYYKTIEVTYSPLTGNYKVDYGRNADYYKRSAENLSEYGTQDKTFVQIFEAALNSKDLKVYFPHGKDEKPIINRTATIAVKEKKNKIKEKFQQWMWSDEERRNTYAPLYNDLFNCNAIPQYDGSSLRVDGLKAGWSLREHQANAVQRILMSGGNVLLAHGTGAGKTLEMAAACMKLRQIGAIRKPMITVPKNLLGQWEREFHSYFPAAKVLIPGENDFTPKNRKTFANKIATGDYDAVIITYEQFEKIPLSAEAMKAYYQEMIDEIIAAEEEAKRQKNGKNFTVKQLAKKRAQLEAKIKELNDVNRDSDNIEFESLGVDALFVDEAHNFKNLFYTTQMQGVADLGDKEGSKRAADLYMKVRYLQQLNGGKGLVFGTATPVMNSVVEMYTMQRYLQGALLEQKGLNTFDAWANEFGEVVEVSKMKAEGNGYETKASMSRYRNLGQLQQMFRGMADVVTQAPGLKLPKLKTGGPIVVECEPSEVQEEFLKDIGERATAIKNGKVKPDEDNILKVYSDGKKMSYSQRMIDPSLPHEKGGKIVKCVENVLKEYKASEAIRGTQLVFCDRGVPGKKDAAAGMFLYQDIKNLLIAGGIPESEIAYAQDYSTDTQKKQMQEAVNEGKIRVLIGSTQAMGTGLNIQKRAVAMHEINAPDRPGDIEQNRGRIVRQGNMNEEVAIYTYITKRTFDSRQWDNLKRKGAFIHQVIAGDFNGQTADGDGDFSASAAEIAAIASDNPLIIEQNELSTKLTQLEALAESHNKEVTQANRELQRLPIEMKRIEGNIRDVKADLGRRVDTAGESFSATISGKTYTKRADAGKAIIEASRKFNDPLAENDSKKIGTIGGLDLYIDNKGTGSLRGAGVYPIKINVDSADGTMQSIENTLKSLDKQLSTYEAIIEKDRKDIEKYKQIANSTFDKAEELSKSRARMDEIMSILVPKNEVGVDEGVGIDQLKASMEIDAWKTHLDRAKAGGYPDKPEDWTADRVGEDKKPMSLAEIVNKIQTEYGVNITAGHVRGQGVLGQFSRRDKGIRTRFFNDLPTISHELGHSLDTKHGITKGKLPKEVASELKKAFEAFVQRDGGEYSDNAYKREGLAEFMRFYMQDKSKASAKYPELTKHVLSKMDPKDLAIFESLADEINAYYALGGQTAADNIRLREKGAYDFRSPQEKIKDTSARMYQAWVDATNSIKRLDKAAGSNAHVLALNSAYADAIAGRLIESDLTDPNGQYVGPGLKDALAGANLQDERMYNLFGEYLVVIHGLEVNANGMQVFADDRMDSAEWMIKRKVQIETQHPEFKETAKKVIDFTDRFTRTWMVDTGLISEAQYKAMTDKYPNYVPFYRVMEKSRTGFGAKRGFANQSAPVMRMKGSGRDIYHPVDNIIDMMVRTVNVAVRNNVMLEIRKAALSGNVDATFMEKIPEPLVPHTFDVTGIKQTVSERIESADYVDSDATALLLKMIEHLPDIETQFETGKAHGNIITILVNGKKEFWKVNDPLLLESITNMSPGKVNGVLAFFGGITRMMTANITGNNAIWAVFSNAPRDLETLSVYSKFKNPKQALGALADTYINALKDVTGRGTVDPFYYEYLAMGGGHASAYSADINLTKNARAKLNPSKMQRYMNNLNPLNWVAFLTDTIEMGPRFATYKLCRQAGYTPQQAFYEAMDVTVNFRRSGVMGRQLGKLIPFFNVSVQGSDKAVRHFTADDAEPKDRKNTAARRFGMFVTVSAILGALQYLLNNKDEEEKDEYGKLSTYTKNSYWVFPTDTQGKYITIPKARELSIISSYVTAIMEAYGNDNPHAFDDFYQYATDNLLPPILSEIAQYPEIAATEGLHTANTETLFGTLGEFGVIGVATNLGANRDFLGRPIVSSTYQYTKVKDQYSDSTSKLAKHLGETFNLSPQQIDYVGNQMLGYIWQTHQALWPVSDTRRDVTLGVKNKYVKDNLYSTDIVNWLYDERDKTAVYDESDTISNQIEKKTDNSMTTFYGRFNRLNKETADANMKRDNRRIVLDMIYDYRKEKENGGQTEVEKAVYGYCEKANDLSVLPGVMETTIKDADKNEYALTDQQYYEYQTLYNGYYWNYIEDTYKTSATIKEQGYVLTCAKSLAKTNATNDMLKAKGVKVADKYSGVSAKDTITFEAGKKEANEDGGLSKSEVIDIILEMIDDGTNDASAETLYKSKYDNDTHIDEWTGSTKDYLIYMQEIPNLKVKGNTTNENKEAVIDYIHDQHISKESAAILWELAGYTAERDFDEWYNK